MRSQRGLRSLARTQEDLRSAVGCSRGATPPDSGDRRIWRGLPISRVLVCADLFTSTDEARDFGSRLTPAWSRRRSTSAHSGDDRAAAAQAETFDGHTDATEWNEQAET